MKFKKARKGYCTKEVDAYQRSTDETLLKQREHIAELKGKCEILEKEVNSYKQRQELIAKSIMNAIQKSEQIENLTRKKYESEMAHLKAFHERWLEYYQGLIKKYPLSQEINALSRFNKNMSAILSGQNTDHDTGDFVQRLDQVQTQFKNENIRLYGRADDNEPEFNPEESIRKLFRRQVDEEAQKKIRAHESKTNESIPQKPSSKTLIKDYFPPLAHGSQAKGAQRKSDAPSSSAMKASQQGAQEEGFSYEECLTPRQSLSDILKDLGLEVSD